MQMSQSTVKRCFAFFDDEQQSSKPNAVKSSTNKYRRRSETIPKDRSSKKHLKTVANEKQIQRNVDFMKRLRTMKMDKKLRDRLKTLLDSESSVTVEQKDNKSVFTDEDFEKFVREYAIE